MVERKMMCLGKGISSYTIQNLSDKKKVVGSNPTLRTKI